MFLPDNIDLGKPEKYILSIRIKPDGFAFLIYDVDDCDTYCYKETSFTNETSSLNNIQRVVFDNNFLTDNFRQTNVVIVSSVYQLIPNEFSNAKDIKKLFELTCNNEGLHILIDENKQEEYELAFGFKEELHAFLKRSLFAPQFHHHSNFSIGYFREKAQTMDGKSMFVSFHDQFVDIICFDKNKNIMLAQTYYKEHNQNIIYYLLSIWEKLEFDQLTDHMFVYGYYPDSKMGDTLKDYIKNINTVGLYDQIVDFGEKSQEIPLDLLTLTK